MRIIKLSHSDDESSYNFAPNVLRFADSFRSRNMLHRIWETFLDTNDNIKVDTISASCIGHRYHRYPSYT